MPIKMRELHCDEHGGNFSIPSRRGRPPRWCTPDNKCDAHPDYEEPKPSRVTPARAKKHTRTVTDSLTTVKDGTGKVVAIQGPKQRTTAPTAPDVWPDGATVVAARKAANKLESMGWEVKRDVSAEQAILTAVRDTELLVMTFEQGSCIGQDYSLYGAQDTPEHMQEAGMPTPTLDFDVEEIPDKELVNRLVAADIQWFNTLSREIETATVGSNITIEHIYHGGIAEEIGADRIVKFVAKGHNAAYRAFRLGALINIG